MTMVWDDLAGFAMDWDWQRGLTVWELAGRGSEPRPGAGASEGSLMTGSRIDGFRLGIYDVARVMEYTKAYDDRETAEQPSR